MRPAKILQLVATAVVLLRVGDIWSQDEFERAPILYSESTPDNCISRLQHRLDEGEVTLTYDGDKS